MPPVLGLRPLVANLGLAACSAGLCLAAVEAVARGVVRRMESRPHTTRGSIIRYHPTLGWAKPPGASAWLRRPEYDVFLEVNAQGLRGPDRPYAKPAGTRRILLLGDSFAEGYTVAEETTARAVLESLLNASGCGRYEVLNAGVMGYSTDQEYLFFLGEGRRYQPDVVIVFFFYNDLFHNATPADGKPYFEMDGARLALRNSPVPAPANGQTIRQPEPRPFRLPPWRGSMALRLISERTKASRPGLHRLLARAGLVEPARRDELIPEMWAIGPGHRAEVDEMWRRTAAILHAFKQEVGSGSGRLLLFYVPEHSEVNEGVWEATRRKYGLGRRQWGFDKVFRRFEGAARDLDLPLVAPHEAFREAERGGASAYFTEDGHWSPRGHSLAAREIARFLSANGWTECPPPASR